MLHASLVAGLFLTSHPDRNWPFLDLQLTSLCLKPSPQETEHSPQGLVVHCGHGSKLHGVVVFGFVLASQLISLSLHSTERSLIPEPQVTEHLLQSPAIHVGHGRMLQASLLEGLFFSLHPGLSWPFGSLQLTLRSLTPSPQETEHSPQGVDVHCGHGARLHGAVVCGFVLVSQLTSLSLHSTERCLTPEPQVTEHLPQSPTIHVGHDLMLQSPLVAGLFLPLHPRLN